MSITLCCAVPFYSNTTPQHDRQVILEAADIVEGLLRESNTKTKSRTRRSSSKVCRRGKEMTPERQTTPPVAWRQLGGRLRQIADKFGPGLNKTEGQRLTSTDGIMSAVITFLLWRIVKKTFL